MYFQATELSSLYTELNDSRHVIENLERRMTSDPKKDVDPHYLTTTSSLSRDAQKRRLEKEHKDQIHALERQLAQCQSRLDDSGKQKNLLVTENEKLSRESKFYHKQTTDLHAEVQKYRSQVEIFQKKFTTSKLGPDGTRQFINPIEEMKAIRMELNRAQRERDSFAADKEELMLKVTVLEDALEYRADEIGLSGHADLLAKISHLRGEITALRRELMDKTELIDNIEVEKTHVEVSKQSLEEQVAQMQNRLAQAHNDLTRVSSSGGEGNGRSLLEQVKAVEQERDLLVEFIQSDMQKSATVGLDLEKCKSQLRVSDEEKQSLQRKLVFLEESLESFRSRVEQLEVERGSCRVRIEESSRRQVEADTYINELKIMLEKKEREMEELYKVQSEFLSQVMTS
jgi:chromosome segregation ATPase